MTSASSCSIRRRVSLIAVSELSSPQPTPTSLSGWSPIAPPVKPFFGSLGSTGLAPANCENAATAPAMFCLSNAPNAPLHSDMIATLIGVPEPPLRGATAGCGSGALAGAAAADVVVAGVDDVAAAGDDVVLSLLLDPQPAALSAKAAITSASQKAPRPGPFKNCIVFSPPRNGYLLCLNRRVWVRPTPSLARCRRGSSGAARRSRAPTAR